MRVNLNFVIPEYWKKTLWALLLVLLLSTGIFFNAWCEIVDTWGRSKTYTHGFVVAPISLWLIWTKRSYYSKLHPQICWKALPVILVFGFLYLVADLIHVLVISQFAVIGMLVTGFWVVIGTNVAKSMLFPLLFLFFMVPAGDQLVMPLMDFTASFTVNMLRLTGLSVYREGTFFTLTSGNWSVVEACSGINYLIASLTLGFVYAYLNYSSNLKRGIFMVLSGVVPIFANGFRAYLIVMIGHLSGMKLAVGVDHIIYGGIFFGFVMLILFYLGSFWRDQVIEPEPPKSDSRQESINQHQPIWLALVFIGFGYLIWQPSSVYLEAKQAVGELPGYLVNMNVTGWQDVPNPQWGWVPKYDGVTQQKTEFYSDGSKIVGVYHASFGKETQGIELINAQHSIIHPDFNKTWRMIDHGVFATDNISSDKSVLNAEGQDLLVLEWYQIGDKAIANAFMAKWYQLCKRLTGNVEPEFKTVVWTQTTHEYHEIAESTLKSFINTWQNDRVKLPSTQ